MGEGDVWEFHYFDLSGVGLVASFGFRPQCHIVDACGIVLRHAIEMH